MVIIITMKNVIKRGSIYYFRIAVPDDCRDSVGKKEITQSLKTKDAAEAATLSKKLTAEWKKKFRDIRKPSAKASPTVQSKTSDTVSEFKRKLDAHMEQYLANYLVSRTNEQLIESSEWLMDHIVAIKNNDIGSIDLSDELGVSYPLSPPKWVYFSRTSIL